MPIASKNEKAHARAERRADVRAMTLGTPMYLYPSGNKPLDVLDAITVNISSVGICIYTDRELQAGSVFRLQSKAVGERSRNGRVIWCKRADEKIYKAGLAFI